MSRVLQILFNTDMVRAILDGRKTVTRRLVKVPPHYPHFYKLHDNTDGALSGTKNRLYAGFYNDEQIFYIDGEKHIDAVYYQAPYQPGDILYVRESVFQGVGHYLDVSGETVSVLTNDFEYYADGLHEKDHWKDKYERTWMHRRPSIHMPKEAARIWLKVKDVRVERLQDITAEDALSEGTERYIHLDGSLDEQGTLTSFIGIWNSTIKKSDLDRYGWDASPWVWVIEFERCEKLENF